MAIFIHCVPLGHTSFTHIKFHLNVLTKSSLCEKSHEIKLCMPKNKQYIVTFL